MLSRAIKSLCTVKQLLKEQKAGCCSRDGLSSWRYITGGPQHFGKESGAFARLEQAGPLPKASGVHAEHAESISGHGQKLEQQTSDILFFRILGHLGNTLFFGSLGAGAYFGYYTYRYNQQQIQELIDRRKDSFVGSNAWCTVMEWYLEKRTYFEGEMRSFANPREDKLLPDRKPGPMPKTLVLDLDEVLIYSDWTRERGWRVYKRPGAEDFVKALAPYYEIVVYSHQHYTYVDPILDQLAPHHISYRLYRADTQYKDGKHMRDLSKLNRDLSQVLFVSANPDSYFLQPENTLKLKGWRKEQGDTMLLDLIPFLQFLALRNADVRDVVKAYEGKDIPSTFRERMKAVEQQQQSARSSRGLFANFTKQ